jgi:integron integrase
MNNKPKRLLDQVRDHIRIRHLSISTEEAYCGWIRRYILFHKKKHPKDMGKHQIEAFLSHLATHRNVAASTQNQAFNALLFLYRYVLEMELDGTINSVRAKRPRRLPTVMTKQEAKKTIDAMAGIHQLMIKLMYGSGLRVTECVRLRVKDVDFEMNQLVVRDGKGMKDRVTVLPDSVKSPLKDHLKRRKMLHHTDLAKGCGTVYLPYALERKYPKADREWGWQYVFPSKTLSRDPRSGKVRRHHMEKSSLQKAVKRAVRLAAISKPVTCHTFRHSFATHLLQDGYDIRTVQELLGHKDVSTTMVYTHVLNKGGKAVRSPLDEET